ncbi:MAG TPA: CocE/NonD family hydrolase [Pyrinomonadaceae bacterium]|nr:CocE/NonD family hydrolase [Pyrinomonadaceae bacterium]
MKTTGKRLTLFVLLGMFLPFRPPLWPRSQAQPDRQQNTQNVQTMKWKFGGNDAGSSTYTTHPDGTFESSTEINIAGMTLKSRLTGKLVDGAITEYELVNQQAGTEVQVSAKDGKARLKAGETTRDVTYKPSKVLFANLHPILTATWSKVLDPAKDGAQKIDVFILDAAVTLPVEVSKKKTRTAETDGKKQVADVYLARLGNVEIDVYLSDANFAAWDVPSQKLQTIMSGYESFLVDPSTLYPELSQPTMTTKKEKAVRVKMRDGAELVADIVRPADDAKHPVIIERTPYGREILSQLEGDWWAKRGYVHIVQDVRGRNDSPGDWIPFVNERKDGYDTIDWVTKQSWSDGNVGMIGGSYVGWVQWAAAVEAHPALKCIVPQVSPPDLFFNFPIDHGVPMLFGALWWSNFVKDKKVPAVPETPKDLEKLRTLPLSKVDDETLGRDIPFYDAWLANETPSAFKSASFMADMNKIKIPVLHISGWWDGDGIGTKMNWARMRALGNKDQWLIYGPWTHLFNSGTRLGDVDFGPDAIIDLDSIYLRWFDTWLKYKQVSWEKQPKVRAFVTGINEWRELGDWPDSRSQEMTLYLSSRGRANGIASVGELVAVAPKKQEPDQYTYDPAAIQIPAGLKNVKNFADLLSAASTVVKVDPKDDAVLLYRTPPMSEPLELGGPIELDLHFSTSAKDTDFFASVIDIDEKGTMRAIGQAGKIRARYLSGWEKPSLLQPGKLYKATIELWDSAHQIKKGHRLGLLISSEMFPSYARNLNTGEPISTATRMVPAQQTIYHDAKHPSALRFRMLPH